MTFKFMMVGKRLTQIFFGGAGRALGGAGGSLGGSTPGT